MTNKPKKKYTAPRLLKVKLRTEESVLVSCKQTSGSTGPMHVCGESATVCSTVGTGS